MEVVCLNYGTVITHSVKTGDTYKRFISVHVQDTFLITFYNRINYFYTVFGLI